MKVKAVIALAVVLPALASLALPAHGSETAYPWTAYFGTHDKSAPWAGSVRGFGRREMSAALRAAPLGTHVDTPQFRRLVEQARELIQTRDLIIPVYRPYSSWKRGMANVFINQVEQDGAKSWKKLVTDQALALAKLPGARERIYWQFGNEINVKKYFWPFPDWAKRTQALIHNDESKIPRYVEYYLAPAVEALHDVSRRAFGADDKIKVLLGTIASGRGIRATDWLAALLQYEIRGRFAKSLAGKKVLDVVDVIGVHYIATKDDERWLSRWDELRARWLGRGRIRGVWATEELGRGRARSGLGGATAIKVAFRYLHWWGRYAMTPREGRGFFWGTDLGEPGTTGDEAMTALYDFLGDVPLTERPGNVVVEPRTNLETYTFEAPLGAKRVIAIISDRKSRRLAIERLAVPAGDWSGDVTASLHVFSRAGHTIVPVTARRQNGGYTLSPHDEISLRGPAAALIFLEPKSPQE